jgi:hypothetical protein
MAVISSEQLEDVGSVTRRSAPVDSLLVLLALGFGILGLRPLSDPDVWWHLRTGELIVSSGFTRTDPWSTASTNTWLLHEWGSEVAMYLSYVAGGYRGVIVLHSVGMLVLATLLIRSIRREAGPVVSAAISLVALIGLMPGTAERPQLVSWCLLASVVPALRRSVLLRRPPWWLIPVIALWANLHGLWSAALSIYGVLIIGLAFDMGFRRWRALVPFLGVAVASTVAAALTPNGPALLLAPLQVREYARFVAEWQPPGLMNPFFACAYILVGVVAVGWSQRRTAVSKIDVALVLGATFLGLAYVRTVPILIIAIAPLAAAALQQLTTETPPAPVRRTRDLQLISGGILTAFAVVAIVWIPQVPPIQRHAPWKASAAVDALPGRARILNEYTLGGWLLWTARDTSPAIDGRTEIYSPAYVERVLSATRMGPGWRKFIAEGHFDAALLGRSSPLAYGLQTLGWTVDFRDSRLVVLIPPNR